MELKNIPVELKQHAQWVVWRSVVSADGRITKPPFQAKAIGYGADVNDPSTWATFEQAVGSWQANPDSVHGIGFVFTEADDFFGIDIDDELKVAPEAIEVRRQLVTEVLKRTNTYTELSPSGTGLHIIGKGKLPANGRRSSALQIEIYGQGRYFTVTGNIYDNRTELNPEQAIIDWLFKDFLPATTDSQSEIVDTDFNRHLDLPDEEVIRRATNLHSMFAPRFNAQVGCEAGKWSDTFIAVVGVLDQITGKVDQLRRIIMASPMVTQAPPAGDGESRVRKAYRNFDTTLARVRSNNSPFLAQVNHGRQIMEAINQRREQVAKENADRILAQAQTDFSNHGVELLKAFPVDAQYLDLTLPTGFTGEIVKAAMAGCGNPFMKFSIPAVLAMVSGIIGRGYKLPNGSGLNANFILAAGTGTGKTQTMDICESMLGQATRAVEHTLAGQSKSRIIKASASSIQGIFDDFMNTPACVWFISECASQLKQMSDPRSTTDAQLRDAYNDLYDASKTGRMFSPPRSVANRKANLAPIENLSVSTYWTTTTSKFDIFTDDAQDGFLSRVVIIRHAGPAGDAIPEWEMQKTSPANVNDRLVAILAMAKQFDERAMVDPQNTHTMTTVVSSEGIEGEVWAYRQISERIKNAALSGDLPAAYTSVARLPMTALRIAAVLAVVDNPYTPYITPEHFRWAFGYLLQNQVALLSDMDTGELGATMSKDIEIVIREMKKMMRKQKSFGVPKDLLTRHMKQIKPFSTAMPTPGEAVKRTMLELLSLGIVTEVDQVTGGRGRPAVIYTPTESKIWTT